MHRNLITLIAALALCHAALAQDAPKEVPQPSPGVNLAKGTNCTFSPAPTYGL